MGCRRTVLIGGLLLVVLSCSVDPSLALPRAFWALSRELIHLLVTVLDGLTGLMQQL